MKNFKIKITLLSLGFATLLSCNKIKDFGDTNQNPNDITSPATYAILTGVETGLTGWAKNNNAAIWVQYRSETQYPGTGLYAIPTFGFGTYTGQLLNLKTIITKSSNADEIAVARILTQYIYWHMTDALGNIPYSEALQGFVPKFDKQEDIYKGMISELKAANAQFINAGGLKGDILNGNNVDKWKKFANSMRAMMAIQLTKRYPNAGDYAATEFAAAIASGVITSNADNIQINYPGGDYKNPYWQDHDGARDNGESVQVFNMLANLGDGRQAAFGSSNTPVPYGLSEADINVWIKNNINWSRILADNQRTETSPVFVLTASEVYMARAEAAERGWTGEDKTAMYNAGIAANFAQWNIPAPAASYYTQSSVVLNGTNNLKKIAEQAYLAAFPNGMSGWRLWRRTGYPVLTPSPAPLNPLHAVTPRRYTFATAEYSLTPVGVVTSLQALVPAASTQAGDLQESRIWWDQ
jgi:hypothetical protein